MEFCVGKIRCLFRDTYKIYKYLRWAQGRILGALAKFRKVTISFVMSVRLCLSVRMEQLD